MTISTKTTMSDYIVEVLKMEGRRAFLGAIGVTRRVSRWNDNVARKRGEVIQMPVAPSFTAETKTEDGAYTFVAASSSNVQLTLNQWKYVQWQGSELVQAFAGDTSVFLDTFANMITALVEKVETDVLAEVDNFTTIPALGADGVPVTYETLVAARKALSDRKVPRENRIAVVSTEDAQSLLTTGSQLSDFSKGGTADSIRTGNLAPLAGFELLESQYVKTSGTENRNLAFWAPAIAIATAPLQTPAAGGGDEPIVRIPVPELGLEFRYSTWFDRTYSTNKHVVDILYGLKVWRPDAGVKIVS